MIRSVINDISKLSIRSISSLSIKRRLACAAVLAACAMQFAAPLHAQNNDPVFDVFSLSATVETSVENDQMTINLQAQAQGSDAAELANQINATMGWAVARLRKFSDIASQTRDYQTHPRYERNGSRIIGWNASQSLQLKTDNFEQAGEAIQTLQERLQVQGIVLSAKTATRKAAEDKLINEALDTFKKRAQLVQLNMGAPGYRMMDIRIDTSDHFPVMHDQMRMRSAEMSSVASAPAIEAGTSQVQVRIDGRIQLE